MINTTVCSKNQIKKIIETSHLPYFTVRGWGILAAIGMVGGIIGGCLFAVAVNQFSK